MNNNAAIIEQSISTTELIDILNIEVIKNTIVCPFHNDTKPSMYIYPDHFYCFACNKHAKIISFTMQYLNLSFKETLTYLADRKNITLNTYLADRKNITLNTYLADRKNIITTEEINKVINLDIKVCIEYHKKLIELYNDYLDINKQYGYLIELYKKDRYKNEELWFKLNQYNIDTVIYNIRYFKKIEKILKENWEIPDSKKIYSQIKNNQELARAFKELSKIE